MIDSSPMYGRAEAVVGKCLIAPGMRERAFVATKVWTRGRETGIEEMQRSLALLGTPRLDLMQIHNLLDWRTHLATLRDWKAEGTIRYLGVTHHTASAHAELAAVMRSEPLDFVQVNYSLEEPEAAQELLPLAADRGIAVIANRPFGGGALVRRLRTQPDSRVGGRIRLSHVVAAAAQVHPRAPAVTMRSRAAEGPYFHVRDGGGPGCRGPSRRSASACSAAHAGRRRQKCRYAHRALREHSAGT